MGIFDCTIWAGKPFEDFGGNSFFENLAGIPFVPQKEHHPPRLISDYLAGGGEVSEQEFRRPHHNHLTSIYSVIDHRDDGNVLIARELRDALLTKICWGILTP